MKKRISIIMLLTISVLMTGCEELHKKPLAYIETNADDRQSETSETETKKKKETEPETEAVEVVEQGSLETERPETETESETEEDKTDQKKMSKDFLLKGNYFSQMKTDRIR